jgi:hypothetical protein
MFNNNAGDILGQIMQRYDSKLGRGGAAEMYYRQSSIGGGGAALAPERGNSAMYLQPFRVPSRIIDMSPMRKAAAAAAVNTRRDSKE